MIVLRSGLALIVIFSSALSTRPYAGRLARRKAASFCSLLRKRTVWNRLPSTLKMGALTNWDFVSGNRYCATMQMRFCQAALLHCRILHSASLFENSVPCLGLFLMGIIRCIFFYRVIGGFGRSCSARSAGLDRQILPVRSGGICSVSEWSGAIGRGWSCQGRVA